MCLPPSSSTQRGRTLQLGPCAYRDHPRYISPPQLGIALQLGPDFLLAPAGLVADKGGLRPGRLLEEAIGALVSPEAQWLRDRREELAASAPLAIRALVFVVFAAAALPVGRLLQLVVEDQNFVVSTGICACIGGGFLELIREPLPTREQRDTDRKLLDEFVAFASERMVPGGRCHENDIVREFRLFYPRYRRRPLGTLRQPVGHAQVSPAISLPPPAHAPSGLHLTRARPALDL